MPRPVRAKANSTCPACGGPIIAGVSQVMKRFKFQDWVHNRRECLYSQQPPTP